MDPGGINHPVPGAVDMGMTIGEFHRGPGVIRYMDVLAGQVSEEDAFPDVRVADKGQGFHLLVLNLDRWTGLIHDRDHQATCRSSWVNR